LTHYRYRDLKKKLYKLFQECDEDNNGVIDTDEFKQVVCKVLPKATDENIMGKIFSCFALNNNGVINYQQLINRPDFETILQKALPEDATTKPTLDIEHKGLELIVESPSEMSGQKTTPKPNAFEVALLKEEKQVLLQDNLSLKVELERFKHLKHENNENTDHSTDEFLEALINVNSDHAADHNKKNTQQRKESKDLMTQPPPKQQKKKQGKASELGHNDLREPLLGGESVDKDLDKDSDKERDQEACGCLKFW